MALDKNNSKLTDNEAGKVNGGTEATLNWGCVDCRYTSQNQITACPICGSTNITSFYTIDDDMLII